MVCKLRQVLDFIREYKLLEDFDDDTITETFNIFPHCCSWDKALGFAEIEQDNIDIAVDKIMEILDESFEHQYSEAQIKEIATSFFGFFNTVGAPKKPVPFVIVILARI